jgi:hypothetical protein
MDPVAMITEIADATASVSKEITQRSELANSPAMQAALVNQRMQSVLDAHRAQIQEEDLAAVRQMVAAPDATPNAS